MIMALETVEKEMGALFKVAIDQLLTKGDN